MTFDVARAVDIVLEHQFSHSVCACGWKLPAPVGDVQTYVKMGTTPSRAGVEHIMSEVAKGLEA